jgi:hypothetical protein
VSGYVPLFVGLTVFAFAAGFFCWGCLGRVPPLSNGPIAFWIAVLIVGFAIATAGAWMLNEGGCT